MAYQTGDTIEDGHYNLFVQGGDSVDHNTANVNSIWGSGTGDKGYGQTGLSTVSAGTTVTATQWANLLNRCTSIADHQGTTITSITNPTGGDTISAYTALSGNVSDLYSNRLNAAASGTDITTNGTASSTTTWYASATLTRTITFGSVDEARYFFNAGGMIRMNYSLTSPPNDKSTEWADLLSQLGTIVITHGALTQTIAGTSYTGTTKIGGSGTAATHATTTGYVDLTSTPFEIYKQYADSSPYTSNYATITASISGAVITITTVLTDAATDTTTFPDGQSSTLDRVGGTLSQTMVVRPPSTTYLSNSWGTPAMNAASWSMAN